MARFLRFSLVMAFAVWQGGFVFYGGVVIPIGTRVLGSDVEQGFITQAVSERLNWIGIICLLIWAASLAVDRKTHFSRAEPIARDRRVHSLSWLIWIGLAIGMLGLFVLHYFMDLQLDSQTQTVRDFKQFKQLHRFYLGISTLQWIGAMALLWYSLSQTGSRENV